MNPKKLSDVNPLDKVEFAGSSKQYVKLAKFALVNKQPCIAVIDGLGIMKYCHEDTIVNVNKL